MTHLDLPTQAAESGDAQLLRIQEVAAALGLTTRTIRYYEEIGLLTPAARSGGDYRLYDADDLERLRFIKDLRDEAGFSLAEIGQLLEDEAARTRNRVRYRSSTDAVERRALIDDALARIDRQVTSLQAKIERLEAMIADAGVRRAHLVEHVQELETGAAPPHHAPDTKPTPAAAAKPASGKPRSR
jgi:DNA-binding transcriptional MerR regulator